MSTSKRAQSVLREHVRVFETGIDVDVVADLELVRARAEMLRSEAQASQADPGRTNVQLQVGRPTARRSRPTPVVILATAALVVAAGLAALTAIGGDATLTVAVVSQGMDPTLRVGQNVAVDPSAYESSLPQRGDVIAFTLPANRDVIAIKRVIGLPGDAVEQFDGAMYVNGTKLDEPYAAHDTRTLGPWTVASDHVFVVGDNRPVSNDSRFSMGQVRLGDIVGRVLLDQAAEDRPLPVPPAPVATRTP
jgi:signal peptidase I